ncbi:hypothetical protein ANN_24841 [Periplaneta americana]|uniref:HTH psq-type domain-containing protein n=1 Tax=Periplaneta americana TaxID=6978 RepID=A0ABQ8RZQ6_PERAM|nr:hypothetical protein ANN_24841 [Periplaneta americana]
MASLCEGGNEPAGSLKDIYMGKVYVRKTGRQRWSKKSMKKTMHEVRNGAPVNAAAKKFNVPEATLRRCVKNYAEDIRHIGEMTLYCASIYYERITTDRISFEGATFDRVQASDLTPMQHSGSSYMSSVFNVYVISVYNTIRSLIASSIRQNASYEVYEEVGCVSSDGSTRRADIIIIDRQKDKGVILDPTIRFEMHEQQPEEVCREKQVIYEPCCQHLGAQYHITHWTVFGLMFGARGTIPRETLNRLKQFNIYDATIDVIGSHVLK